MVEPAGRVSSRLRPGIPRRRWLPGLPGAVAYHLRGPEMAPVRGIEPRARSVGDCRSTTELHRYWHGWETNPVEPGGTGSNQRADCPLHHINRLKRDSSTNFSRMRGDGERVPVRRTRGTPGCKPVTSSILRVHAIRSMRPCGRAGPPCLNASSDRGPSVITEQPAMSKSGTNTVDCVSACDVCRSRRHMCQHRILRSS